MTIDQKPDALNFSGNLPDIVVSGLSGKLNLKLSDSSGLILEENYSPFAGSLTIRLRDIIHSLLEIEIPPYEGRVFTQAKGYRNFTVQLTSGTTETFSFVAIKAFLQRNPFDVELFVRQNWLTFQPRVKSVSIHDPQWLTCFPLETSSVRVEAIFANNSTQLINYASLSANKLQSVHVQPGMIMSLFAEDPVSFKIWVESAGQIRQYKQTFIIDDVFDVHTNDVFVFENRLGGLDSIRFTGQRKYNHSTNFETALFDEFNIDYSAEPGLAVEKNTGFLKSAEEKAYSLDFFRSIKKYHVLNGRPSSITLNNLNLEDIPGELSSYSFNFQYSDNKNALPEYGAHGISFIDL